LEAALAKLEQDGDDQDSWDQVSNAFQFLADSAREGTTTFFASSMDKEGRREKEEEDHSHISMWSCTLAFYNPLCL
jgi:hypothetical protein